MFSYLLPNIVSEILIMRDSSPVCIPCWFQIEICNIQLKRLDNEFRKEQMKSVSVNFSSRTDAPNQRDHLRDKIVIAFNNDELKSA